MATIHSTSATTKTPSRRSWRVVDIVVASVIGVASGVIFWAWQFVWGALSIPLAFLPGLSGLLAGGWLFAGVLGGLIVRKPGAAFFTEVLAALVSMAIGTQWGWETLISGLVQGAGAELVLAIFLYSNWRAFVAVIAGIGAGIGLLSYEFFSYYVAMDAAFKIVYAASVLVSGGVVAGLGSWYIVRGLAATGALSRFASGREAAAIVE
jgi:energy-coupling factor transport system permease protein